jgi:RNA polymerase sigma factor (TIGR02999 family)
MSRRDITDALIDRSRDPAALDRFVPILYDELRRVARAHLHREAPNHTLQPTALVHEVYLRLVNIDRMTIEGRTHFLSLAARVMRQILVDHARRRRAEKRGGEVVLVSLEEAGGELRTTPTVDVIALDMALDDLAAFDPRQRDIVDLKFFGGLTIDEIGAALGISTATVEREWAVAKAWLFRRMVPAPASGLGAGTID